MIEAVTFDITHTLIHSPRLGDIYAEILRRHGMEIDGEEARRLISVGVEPAAALHVGDGRQGRPAVGGRCVRLLMTLLENRPA